MLVAEVLGSVVADQHHEGYDGRTLLMVRTAEGEDLLAVDRAQAGPGDRVLVLREGTGVRQILGGQPPIRTLIVGIIDRLDDGC